MPNHPLRTHSVPGQPIRPDEDNIPEGRQPIPILSSSDTWTGSITKINKARGFGFIKPDGNSWECFFHFSVVKGGLAIFQELEEGDEVSFQAVSAEKGPRAVRVWE